MPYFETADGTPIYFVDAGPRDGSALVLIHAEPLSSKFWEKNIPVLSRAFRVVAMDVRGRGDSGKTDTGQSIRQYADDLRALIEALELERVVVVGWSLGSSIVWSYIEQFGQARLAGFVNVDQSPYRFVSEEHVEARRHAIRTRRLQHHIEVIANYLGDGLRLDEADLKRAAYECMKTPTSCHLAVVNDSYYADFRPHLTMIAIPNQLYWSPYGTVAPDMAKFMERATPRCELVFFENCGHLIPWLLPDLFNRELGAFAKRVLG